MKKNILGVFVVFLLLGFAGVFTQAKADPINLNFRLTGDFRAENPDNLIVDVNISFNTESNVSSWIVDINSPDHPNVKLDAFYFNLALPVGVTASLGNFDPANAGGKQWASVGGTNANGSGGADFDFGVGLTGGGSPLPNQVNNSTNLLFDVTLTGGFWTRQIITTASLSNGGGIPSPGAQMGAHLQSLNLIPSSATSDSGFASGAVPEPATLLLFGTGLIGLIGFGKKFRKS